MINFVLRFFLHVQRGNAVGDVIHGDDIELIRGTEGKHRQPGEKHERAHHIKLRGFGAAAISEHDARPQK